MRGSQMDKSKLQSCEVTPRISHPHQQVEEQAIDRAHRIGQTRTLHVIRYLVKGTPVAVGVEGWD